MRCSTAAGAATKEWRLAFGGHVFVSPAPLHVGAGLVLLVYSTSSSFFQCFALLVQTGLGLDPFMAGSIFAPCSVGFVLASLAAPRLVARWGTQAILTGALIYAVSVGLLIAQVQMAGAELGPTHLIPRVSS